MSRKTTSRSGWARPRHALASLPAAMPLLRAAYAQLAAGRHCRTSACPGAAGRPVQGHLAGGQILGKFISPLTFCGSVPTFKIR